MHIVIYSVYLLARILGYKNFKKAEEDDPNINIKTILYSTKKFLSFFILPIFWFLFARSDNLITFLLIGIVTLVVCIIMSISKNIKLILLNFVNIGELFLFGFPSIIGIMGRPIGSSLAGDVLYFLSWKILSW